MSANEHQVGGTHYKNPAGLQHWDIVKMFDLDYFQGQITKYVFRWKAKNGVEDLKKARHFLDKYIELHDPKEVGQVPKAGPTIGGAIHPTAYVGFTYEGGNAEQDFFRCKGCLEHISIGRGNNPHNAHHCKKLEQIKAGYVIQRKQLGMTEDTSLVPSPHNRDDIGKMDPHALSHGEPTSGYVDQARD